MAIIKGSLPVDNIYFESINVDRVFLNNVIVYPSEPGFITVFETTSVNQDIELPLVIDSSLEGFINWGDGSPLVNNNSANRLHTFADVGLHIIEITGSVGSWDFLGVPTSTDNIVEVSNWGTFSPESICNFSDCINLDVTATDNLIVENVSMDRFFNNCSSLIGNSNFINYTMKPTSAFAIFAGASLFNQPIIFDGSVCVDWSASFQSTTFNKPLTNAVSSVCTKTSSMFQLAKWDQDVSSWDMSNVSNTSFMFDRDNVFTGTGITTWDMSSAANRQWMFVNNSSMEENISVWDWTQTTNLFNFMGGKNPSNFSTLNADLLLLALDSQLDINIFTDVRILLGTIDYTIVGAVPLLSLEGKGFVVFIGDEV